jgi:hypothetical protein
MAMQQTFKHAKEVVAGNWRWLVPAVFLMLIASLGVGYFSYSTAVVDPLKDRLGQTERELDTFKQGSREAQRVLNEQIAARTQELKDTETRLEEVRQNLGAASQNLETKSALLSEKEARLNEIAAQLNATQERAEQAGNRIADMNKMLEKAIGDLPQQGAGTTEKSLAYALTTLRAAKRELEELKLPNYVAQVAQASLACNRSDLPFEVKTEQTKTPEGIAVSFYIESKVNFKPGNYSMKDAYQGACFTQALGKFIQDIKNARLEFSTLDVRAAFEGGADAYVPRNLVYDGQFDGDVVRDHVLVDGEAKDIRIPAGSKISNADLAFLRAYSVYHHLRQQAADGKAIPLPEGDFSFKANQSGERGAKYRYGSIELTVRRIPKDTREEDRL